MPECVEAATGTCVAGRDRGGSRAATRPTTVSPLAARAVRLIAGLWLFAIGLSLMVRANLGLSAWDVLHDALRSLTPLTFGQVVIVVSVAVLGASLALRVRPGPGTVTNAVLVGVFTDSVLRAPLLTNLPDGHVLPRLIVMLVGIGAIALGTALYISANLGAGPRDALMLGVARHSHRSTGAARFAIEACVLIVGIILGGTAGVGTLAFVALIGPAINLSFRLFGMKPPRPEEPGRVRAMTRTLTKWGRRGQLGASSTTQASRDTGARI